MLTQATLVALDKFLQDWAGYGINQVIKEAKSFVRQHDCAEIFRVDDTKEFHDRWLALFVWHNTSSYNSLRLEQLKASNFKFWMYRRGHNLECDAHGPWDGLALAAEHPFWETHYPANGWFCDCHVIGVRTESGITRSGGKTENAMPKGWFEASSSNGLPRGIAKGFSTQFFPTLPQRIAAFEEGHHHR